MTARVIPIDDYLPPPVVPVERAEPAQVIILPVIKIGWRPSPEPNECLPSDCEP